MVGYIDDPNGRGTPSLLVSCVLTLILCVWSALHLNVPSRDQTRLQDIFLNARWIIAGIYAPELVVFTAWRQWSSARILNQTVQDTISSGSYKSLQGSRKPEWSMTHSFFACAGGFAFELESTRQTIHDLPLGEKQRCPRVTITARGMALLARCGYLPDVEEDQIEDKSKANDLAKATVVVQATWMLLQVISRLAFRLPVTLLEVNTVAHVLCAFAMYLFWWHKPLLPNAPVILRDEALAPLAMFMYSSSEMSGYVNPSRVQSQTIVKTFFAYLSLYYKTPELETLCLRQKEPALSFRQGHDSSTDVLSLKGTNSGSANISDLASTAFEFQHIQEECDAELRATRQKEKGTAFFERRPQVHDKRPVTEAFKEIDGKRWALIQAALASNPNLFEDRVLLSHQVGNATCIHLRPEQLVADHIQNWPSNDLLRSVGGLIVGMVLWLANFCYGGIHAAAWKDSFPSTAEKWIWRASASYIGFCGGLWVVLNFIVGKYPRLNSFWERWMDGEKSWWQSVSLGVVVFLCGFSLMLARIFIVLEAFISIRELPEGAYQTPQWTNVFPHF